MEHNPVILGKGTYGIVTTAPNVTSCRKIFPQERALSLIREAYIIKKLSHIQGITEMLYLDYPTHTDNLLLNKSKKYNAWGVIVMKRYHTTLIEWMKTHPSYDKRVKVWREIMTIMRNVHAAGIMHADIKLENVMLAEDGSVRIIDWGLSGTRTCAKVHLSAETYSPKTIVQDFCHDVYSLGILTIELLLGSSMLNVPDYNACVSLIRNSTKWGRKLQKLIERMIHPDCTNRPNMNKIARYINLPPVTAPKEIVVPLSHVEARHGVKKGVYPKIICEYLHNKDTLYTVLGAIYGCKDCRQLTYLVDYRDIVGLISYMT